MLKDVLAGFLLFIIVLGGLWLRYEPARELPFWYDEADTWKATHGLPYERFIKWENHFETAPLSFLLVRWTTDLTGQEDPFTMRLPAFICGLLCIPLAFALGRVIHSSTSGLVLALFAAVNPLMVDQSVQCRMYAVFVALLLAVTTLAIVLLRKPNRSMWQWTLMGLLLGLLMWTQQFAAAAWVGLAGAGAMVFVGLLFRGDSTSRKREATKRLEKQPTPQPKPDEGYQTGPMPTSAKGQAAGDGGDDADDAKSSQRTGGAGRLFEGGVVMFIIAVVTAQLGVFGTLHRVFYGGVGDGAELSPMDIAREIAVAASDFIGLTPAGLGVYLLGLIGLAMLVRHCKTSTAVLVCLVAANLLILFPFRQMHHFMAPRYLIIAIMAFWVGVSLLPALIRSGWGRGLAWAAVLAFAGLQTWQSLNLHTWRQQPDRYLPAELIVFVRDHLEPTWPAAKPAEPGETDAGAEAGTDADSITESDSETTATPPENTDDQPAEPPADDAAKPKQDPPPGRSGDTGGAGESGDDGDSADPIDADPADAPDAGKADASAKPAAPSAGDTGKPTSDPADSGNADASAGEARKPDQTGADASPSTPTSAPAKSENPLAKLAATPPKQRPAICYHPQVLELLGRYYGLPTDPALDQGLYDNYQLRENPAVPTTFNNPTTIMIIGMVNYEGRVKKARQTVELVAKHYGVTPDAAAMDQHIKQGRACLAVFTKAGVAFESIEVQPFVRKWPPWTVE